MWCSFLVALVMFALALPLRASDILPGLPQDGPIAIVGGTLHPVSGPVIEHGTLLFAEGKITAVGADIDIPEDAERIDAEGMHVYPGLFEAHSQIGLTEIASIRASRDYGETGTLNPNVSAHVSVNPDSEIIPVTRSNGVLLTLTAPAGGLIAGKAAVLQLDGWTYEDLTLRPDVALVVDWPWEDADEDAAKAGQPEQLRRLREFFSEAGRYRAARDGKSDQRFDIRLEAMQPVLDREVPLLVQADELAEIRSAVAFAVEQDVRLIIFGGYDAPLCADLLKEHDVPVIVSAVHRNPSRRHDAYDAAYTLPQRLAEQGVRFCISGSERSDSWNARNLPYHAGTAVAYGLTEDDALRAITLSPAEILGMADRVGSLEVGKDATLIVTTGSPLETTSQVEHAWIQGRHLDLDNKQRQLYRKYREKYQRTRERDGSSVSAAADVGKDDGALTAQPPHERRASARQTERRADANGAADPWETIKRYFTPPPDWQGQLGGYASPFEFADGTKVQTPADWKRRRAEILAEWQNLLGHWPPLITNQEMEILATERRENFTQHRVRFRWTPDATATGYLLIPDGKGPHPAVITVYYEPETAIGLGEPYRDFALQLARRGFVTLSIGATEATAAKTYGLYYPSIDDAQVQPLSMLAYAAANAWHALAGRPEVDAERIGIVGHSFGGKWALFASCLFDKFACAAWSDPGIVFDESRSSVNYWEPWYLGYHPKPWRPRGVITPENPARGLYPQLTSAGRDLHELHALMAPRPFLVSGGSEDPPRRWQALNHTIEVNRILGQTHRVGMTNRAEHAPNADSNEVIYAFFEHFLNPEPAD